MQNEYDLMVAREIYKQELPETTVANIVKENIEFSVREDWIAFAKRSVY